jgi:magnesium transporter
MKALAALTIVVSLPGTVAGFFGMNVMLPLSDANPFAFLVVFGIALALTVTAIYIFYKRDWF